MTLADKLDALHRIARLTALPAPGISLADLQEVYRILYFGCGANMPAGWDDVTESVAAYSGCATTLFEQKNYGQPEYAIHVNASVSSLGSFNNEADSQLFCNYFGCEE